MPDPLTVLITGASSGIGAVTALHLDELGHHVIATAPDERELGDALAQASPRLQRRPLDVRDPDLTGVDRLDALVNNAGIGVPGPLEVLDPDALREQLEVNVVGQVATTQAALPALRDGTAGRIVFVGSVGGKVAAQFAGPYHASKFAIEAIADVWRQELEPEQLSVILVEPSAISTAIWDKAIGRLNNLLASEDPRLARYRERLDDFRDSLGSADDHGKDPHDVAETIAEALTTDRPDTRYVVGGSGKLATALRPLVPDRLADKLAERT